MKCPVCQNAVSQGDRFCENCGSSLMKSNKGINHQKTKMWIIRSVLIVLGLGIAGGAFYYFQVYQKQIEPQATLKMDLESHILESSAYSQSQAYEERPQYEQDSEADLNNPLPIDEKDSKDEVSEVSNEDDFKLTKEYSFSKENVINDASPMLWEYYSSYLAAINEQDISYLSHTTSAQTERLKERIFGVNKDDIFTLNQIIIDLDTINLHEGNSQMNVSFNVAFTFSYKSRSGSGKLSHGANIQLVSMLYDENNREWVVDNSKILQNANIGSNRLVLQ